MLLVLKCKTTKKWRRGDSGGIGRLCQAHDTQFLHFGKVLQTTNFKISRNSVQTINLECDNLKNIYFQFKIPRSEEKNVPLQLLHHSVCYKSSNVLFAIQAHMSVSWRNHYLVTKETIISRNNKKNLKIFRVGCYGTCVVKLGEFI